MSHNQNTINVYGKNINDIEVSPFESIDMLHLRSKIEKLINDLTNEERISLYGYDLKLISNAKQVSNHIEKVYDFSWSDEPFNEWWWHLDKVALGTINFNLIPNVNSNTER